MYTKISSIGAYVPSKKVLNNDLDIDGINDEWIYRRTGIKSRFISENEYASEMGIKAAKKAIKRSKISINQLDLIICTTGTPDHLISPSTACIISKGLDLENIPAFDLNATCSGFIYALYLAKSLIKSKLHRNILIVTTERMSSYINWKDKTTSTLFGDAASAVIITSTNKKEESILDINISANGKFKDIIYVPDGGSNNPYEEGKDIYPYLSIQGTNTLFIAIPTLTNSAKEILKKNKLTLNDINYYIPHQANARIIESVKKKLNIDDNKVVNNIKEFGNTSSSSIPLSINKLFEEKKFKKNDLILISAFGGGITWGSALFYFAMDY